MRRRSLPFSVRNHQPSVGFETLLNSSLSRLSTATFLEAAIVADRILPLEGGKLVEQGTHKELMTLGRRGAGLFDLLTPGGEVSADRDW